MTTKSFKFLTDLARFSIEYYLKNKEEPKIEPKKLPKIWTEKGACFVSLYRNERLRGCIGTVLAHQPLYLDLVKNAIGAAFHDPRFEPLKKEELEDLKIEISVLTKPKRLEYKNPDELISFLYDKKPGVMIESMGRRAVFIPKVWEQVRKAEDFLGALCFKAGLPGDFWRVKKLRVWIFYEK